MSKRDEFNLVIYPRDTDLNLKLPNGQIIQLQFRIGECESLDICLGADLTVTNWIGVDTAPAPMVCQGGDDFRGDDDQEHVRLAQQLCVDFPEGTLRPEGDDA